MKNSMCMFSLILAGLIGVLSLCGCASKGKSESASSEESKLSAVSSTDKNEVSSVNSSEETSASQQSKDSSKESAEASTKESTEESVNDGSQESKEERTGDHSAADESGTPEKQEESHHSQNIITGVFSKSKTDENRENYLMEYEAEVSVSNGKLYFRMLLLNKEGDNFSEVRQVSVGDIVSSPYDKESGQTQFELKADSETIRLNFKAPDTLEIKYNDDNALDKRNGTYQYRKPTQPPSKPGVKHDPQSPDGKMDAGIAEAARSMLGLEDGKALTAEDCAKITNLSIGGQNNPTTTLDGIEYFVNLKSLSVSESYLTDISALSQLTGLESISFNDDLITEIPDLSACKKLKSVSFVEEPITDLSPLNKIKNLKQVVMIANYVKSIAPLKNNHTITSLSIDDTCISDWETIADNETLKKALMYDYDKYVAIEKRAKEILAETITDDMTDLEKQIRIAEYIQDYINYDLTDETLEDGQPLNYYGILKPTGVCKNYTLTAKYLMNLAGLTVRSLTSWSHAWNAILLDGKWYEFDCTWNDNLSIEKWPWFNRSREYMNRNRDHVLDHPDHIPYAGSDMAFMEYCEYAQIPVGE